MSGMTMWTKREVICKLIRDFEKWLAKKDILDLKSIDILRQANNITTGRIVALVEKFALPAHKSDQMKEYVGAEVKKAQFMCFKTREMFSDNPELQSNIDEATVRLKAFTDDDHAYVTRQFTRICQVLEM